MLTSDSEGFPNALIEPMSVGIPIVSTDYPVIKELIADGKQGFIVPRNDAATMAAKIGLLLDNPQLQKQMGNEGMNMVRENLSRDAMAKNLFSVYEKHINSSKSTI